MIIHTFRFPSAVSRSRLQPVQKFSLIDVMKPICPAPPATFQAFQHRTQTNRPNDNVSKAVWRENGIMGSLKVSKWITSSSRWGTSIHNCRRTETGARDENAEEWSADVVNCQRGRMTNENWFENHNQIWLCVLSASY